MRTVKTLQGMIVAFSGGKDSTAMALHLWETGVPFKLLYTPTGNELPEVDEHITRVLEKTGAKLVVLDVPTLGELIDEQDCLPNWRMRWCTRIIKIEPVVKWLRDNQDAHMCVGLRADEPGRVGLIEKETKQVHYPLREWGWNLDDVIECNARHGLTPPKRTDCAVCFFQTLYEWWMLWKNYPKMYTQGVNWERQTGHTFRSPGRDTRPAALSELAKLFHDGWVPAPRKRKITCRVCNA